MVGLSFQERLEQLGNLADRIKASVQWQRLSFGEARDSPALGLHFYETAVREREHLDGLFMPQIIRMHHELMDPNTPVSDQDRVSFLKRLNTLFRQISWIDHEGRWF